ncbi:multidrug efflux RND transporter periplasmic adaptor subunit BepD [Brucella sp. BO3]|uniref:Multidrug efflux RND transporter periplasmic adaptor subunit BepD n=1 Tax=Brucella inopinata TaxID=1218315 RepID=A0AAW7B6I5_9HYPH|nr:MULTISPECIES: multidrug efflux RND transporter periplasmic adaptor subunit BepD [Brucella]EFM56544.1 efflux transporter, RND family, MFP subunit [Brucella inopinata BO1]MDL2333866.1 multidrug efflux RND transporter periplasmic adaptor subunit BepD [Brucella inopinata]OEI82387.1 efflux transporter periplasmic adaptor subunit [Brucella sp. B13-0095]QGA57306.1 multidrug efflux RND transporter periplasmic adaptor subunit BepD [Brucella sp. 2280]QMV25677.1 multidrug efflux RND transporter peripl
MTLNRTIRCFAAGAAFIVFAAQPVLAQAPGGATPPPPQVFVVDIKPHDVPVTYEYAARISAYRNVQVRARVGGILLHRNFVEGTQVKAGEVLFEIDPAPYQAELEKAQAQVAQAEAQYQQSIRDAERAEQLVQQKVQSAAVRDSAFATRDLNKAAVAAAKAQLRTAELNLSYTKVTAPISGITSQEQVNEGSLIGTDASSSLLTSVTQLDPVYVNFSFTDTEAAEIAKLRAERGATGEDTDRLKIKILFGDGQAYDHEGTIDFTSSSLDTETGTLGVRAVVENPNHRLIPGQFVRAEILDIQVKDAITVPKAALMQSAQGQFVYVVNKDNVVEVRPVTGARELKDDWLISQGLNSGDRVITEGVIKAVPGRPVQPVVQGVDDKAQAEAGKEQAADKK